MNDFKQFYDHSEDNKRIWEKFIKNNPNRFLLKDFERIKKNNDQTKFAPQSNSVNENSD